MDYEEEERSSSLQLSRRASAKGQTGSNQICQQGVKAASVRVQFSPWTSFDPQSQAAGAHVNDHFWQTRMTACVFWLHLVSILETRWLFGSLNSYKSDSGFCQTAWNHIQVIRIRFACDLIAVYRPDLRRNLIGIRLACSLNPGYESDLRKNLLGIRFTCSLSAALFPVERC